MMRIWGASKSKLFSWSNNTKCIAQLFEKHKFNIVHRQILVEMHYIAAFDKLTVFEIAWYGKKQEARIKRRLFLSAEARN